MRPAVRLGLVLALCLATSGCAASVWMGQARRAIREPGQRLLDLPEAVQKRYGCDERPLPHLELEKNELNPNRIAPGDELNHRMVYALCPRSSTEVVAGTLTTQVRFKGAVVVRDRIQGFELKPGRWSIDAFVRLPESAEPGVYALEIEFAGGGLHLAESLTFGVDR